MDMIDFSRYSQNGRYYRGEAGRKFGIDLDGENWILKFPKSTVGFTKPSVSYTTSPLSEYLGSRIYASLGIPVHETILGAREGKIVVACKDFAAPDFELIEFREIKNAYLSATDERNDGTGSNVILDEVLDVIGNEQQLSAIPGVKERFWDMFVIDAMIGNPDRNNGNWGVLTDAHRTFFNLAPVYDNGNGFFNTRNDDLFEKRLAGKALLEDAFGSSTSIYRTVGEDGSLHHIRPFTFLKNTDIVPAQEAVLKVYKGWDQNAVEGIIDSIPRRFMDMDVITSSQATFYKNLLSERAYNKEKGLKALAQNFSAL